jgi:hypothetical protein
MARRLWTAEDHKSGARALRALLAAAARRFASEEARRPGERSASTVKPKASAKARSPQLRPASTRLSGSLHCPWARPRVGVERPSDGASHASSSGDAGRPTSGRKISRWRLLDSAFRAVLLRHEQPSVASDCHCQWPIADAFVCR